MSRAACQQRRHSNILNCQGIDGLRCVWRRRVWWFKGVPHPESAKSAVCSVRCPSYKTKRLRSPRVAWIMNTEEPAWAYRDVLSLDLYFLSSIKMRTRRKERIHMEGSERAESPLHATFQNRRQVAAALIPSILTPTPRRVALEVLPPVPDDPLLEAPSFPKVPLLASSRTMI